MPERIRKLTSSHEAMLFVVVVLSIVVFSLSSDNFFSPRNLYDILTTNAYLGIMCSGLVVVLIAGGIDLSFAAIASVSQYIALSIVNEFGGNWLLVLALGCSIGIVFGAVNAVLIYYFRIRSIIATIATLNVLYGLLITLSGGQYIFSLPRWFRQAPEFFEISTASGDFPLINVQIAMLIFSFALTAFVLGRTNIGRQIYAMGGNPESARRVGFNLARLHIFVYGYMGFCAGLASIAQAQLAQSVLPNALVGKELDVLAAVVIGGARLVGGVGTAIGTILGVALVAIMKNGLLLAGVSSYWLQFYTGAVIIVAVVATAMQTRTKGATA